MFARSLIVLKCHPFAAWSRIERQTMANEKRAMDFSDGLRYARNR